APRNRVFARAARQWQIFGPSCVGERHGTGGCYCHFVDRRCLPRAIPHRRQDRRRRHGAVYRATDTRLGREVALKFLSPWLARDADYMARFEREAKVLASLNHPNIAVVHGLEESNGTRALVMELVEGRTLAARIAEGPIPLKEALRVAGAIAEGLEAANEK